MNESTARDLIDKLLKHRSDRGWSALYADDVRLDFPQVGAAAEWSVRAPNVWVHEYRLDNDDGEPALAVVVTEFADGVVARERVYLTQAWT
ncbi:hypothetical protein [Tenggerimyces flavus]|uniref:SnoaL-like domain-containing protein n=1 Tax=Tenggerimyces flavus TaxID=1708749 RepID=A0ABV7YNK9_9ACTN|nr:hypothetical protein [Tenggerimyces flavus]MBM7789428.1 hypothetical protein [Tenggerimyces flavus]